MPPPSPPFCPPFPPSPQSAAGGSRSRILAHLSWITVLISFLYQFLAQIAVGTPQTRVEYLVRGLISFSLAIAGLTCGIVALHRNRKHRHRGVRVPARTGVGIWLFLFLLQIPILWLGRHRAEERREASKAVFRPAVHIPGGVAVHDAELGFSFELPADYVSIPEDKKPAQYRLMYLQQSGDARLLVLVETMGGTISPYDRLTARYLPAGKNETLTPFTWRGLPVDGVRIPERTAEGEVVTFKVQIPLQKRAIQIGVGGLASNEGQARALAEQVLSTLDGPVNW